LGVGLPESQVKAYCPWLFPLSLTSALGQRREKRFLSASPRLPLGLSVGDGRVLCPGFSSQLWDRLGFHGVPLPSALEFGNSLGVGSLGVRCCPPSCLLHCPPGPWVGRALRDNRVAWGTSGGASHPCGSSRTPLALLPGAGLCMPGTGPPLEAHPCV
jgi:hypothetical protein